MLPKRWNDLLALIVIALIVGSWALLSRVGLSQEQQGLIIGAGIVWVGNIVQFYFRRAPPEGQG